MPSTIGRMVERAYSVTPVCIQGRINNLCLSFSGVSNLHLSVPHHSKNGGKGI